ncbi:MAG: HAMP domain-containing histidine kinase [Verrucomicrobia bacterium]|nr:HAMP domain-containing histidine kinase [Verrucomicrobiota bacterium]MBU1733623.1 HAMP domain-containing histidine kinase [Verrucomicrobiota bacterium]
MTGRKEIFARILAQKQEKTRVIGSEDARIIFHLLDLQQEVSDRLEDDNLILERRVLERTTEQEKANKELEQKIIEYEKLNEKLQQINNEKTKYLMHATHQLKAPFAAIQSYTDLILEGYVGEIPKTTRAIVEKINKRCILLSDSIKDMLELANLKSLVKENIQMSGCPLDSIISSVVKHLAALTVSREIKISVPATLDDVFVQCNRNQILILLSNLLENAIYYSPNGATISIAFKAVPASLVKISVTDHGIGIDEKHLPRIFEEYFRANKAVAVNERGTGLGLAIAMEIAEIHGTKIEVESTLGKGSVFSFHLKTAQKTKIHNS